MIHGHLCRIIWRRRHEHVICLCDHNPLLRYFTVEVLALDELDYTPRPVHHLPEMWPPMVPY